MAKDHFEKHHYQKDRVDWNFNLLFEGQQDVARMIEEYAPLVNDPGLYNPIPTKWLHATILRVGLLQDYAEAEMLAVAAKLQDSLATLELPEFFFDSWWLWGGNVVLHISPDDEFSKIYHCVIDVLRAVVGDARVHSSPHGELVAHATLAYARTHHNERQIHQRLLENPVKPAAFKAAKLSLVKQRPTDGHYGWEVVSEIPIGRA